MRSRLFALLEMAIANNLSAGVDKAHPSAVGRCALMKNDTSTAYDPVYADSSFAVRRGRDGGPFTKYKEVRPYLCDRQFGPIDAQLKVTSAE